MEESNEQKLSEMDNQARELVMELGRRVYQVGLLEQEIKQIKDKILELNLAAYEMRKEAEVPAGDVEQPAVAAEQE